MIFALLTLVFSNLSLASPKLFQNGDIIFHESQSNQSKAIREATDSRWSHVGMLFEKKGKWFVAEAVQPVKLTPLSSFIARGKNREYRVYRLPNLSEEQKLALRNEAASYLGQNYDIYFEWSDDLIYCSELVYKVFQKVTGVEIGSVQQYRDLKLDGPYVKELIRRRLTDTGRALQPEEYIVTPASQVEDDDLVLVK
jgi:uncharacterized protein YycO